MPECRGDQNPVVGDIFDPPAGGSEREHVANAGFVDHFFIQLTDPFGGLGICGTDQEDTEETAVRDGTPGNHGQTLCTGPGGQCPSVPVPHQPRFERGELIGGVLAREHVQGREIGAAWQLGVGCSPAHSVEPSFDLQIFQGHRRERLLGQDIQGVGWNHQLLNLPGAHPGDH